MEALERAVYGQREVLQKMVDEKRAISGRQQWRYPFFEVKRNKETNVVEEFSRKESIYQQAKRLCGFLPF